MAKEQLITVPFYGATLTLIDHNGEPYVAMKPIVEAMDMTWQSQHVKIAERFGSTITEIVIVAEDGKRRPMTCLPLRKLPGWLMTIHPNKVRPEIRETIITYQNECDDALWSYWSQGHATRPVALSPALDKELTSRINRRAWGLAHVAYENYRTRMMADAKVMDGSKTPEAWHPDEITQDVVQHMAVIANVLDGFAQKARDRGRDLAELVGMNYDTTVEQYFCPQQQTARVG